MARTLTLRVPAGSVEDVVAQHHSTATDASLTSEIVYEDVESSARLIVPTTPLPPALPNRPPARPSPELVPTPARLPVEPLGVPDEPPRYTSRNWRAEAWDRERERELHSVERLPGTSARRRSGS